MDSNFTAPCNTSILYPADGGNMHCFTAVTACAVLDVLGPPYSDPDGRHCTYYLDYPFSGISGACSIYYSSIKKQWKLSCMILEIKQKSSVLHFPDLLCVSNTSTFHFFVNTDLCLTKTKIQWRECRRLKRRGKDMHGLKKERGRRNLL